MLPDSDHQTQHPCIMSKLPGELGDINEIILPKDGFVSTQVLAG